MRVAMTYGDNPRVRPVVAGEVTIPGVEIACELGHPGALHLLHLRENRHDAFEFSLSGYLVARDRPDAAHLDWVGIPIFLTKSSPTVALHVNTASGVRGLADLKGKTIGIPDFGMTAGVWLRILLDQLHGIKAGDVRWVNGRPPERRHSDVLHQDPPPDVEIGEMPAGATLQELLDRGEVDAAFGDRMRVPVNPSATARPLFSPREAVELFAELQRKTGASPINHTLLIQRSLAQQHPWLPRVLFEGLERSKQLAYQRDPAAKQILPDQMVEDEPLGPDPFVSGLRANRRMLALLGQQLAYEHQISRAPDPDDLYEASVRDT